MEFSGFAESVEIWALSPSWPLSRLWRQLRRRPQRGVRGAELKR
jgi:hypothetical protein